MSPNTFKVSSLVIIHPPRRYVSAYATQTTAVHATITTKYPIAFNLQRWLYVLISDRVNYRSYTRTALRVGTYRTTANAEEKTRVFALFRNISLMENSYYFIVIAPSTERDRCFRTRRSVRNMPVAPLTRITRRPAPHPTPFCRANGVYAYVSRVRAVGVKGFPGGRVCVHPHHSVMIVLFRAAVARWT